MAYTSLPTVTPGAPTRASWGNLVDSNLDDHESRIGDLETATIGTGDVVGPASATADAPALFDGTTGKLIKAGPPLSLAGVGAYLSLVGPVLTRALIDLVADVTGRLPWANVAAAPAANRLLGRGSAGGAGDWEPIALGAGLAFSGTTLSATGGGSAGTLDDLTDVAITTPTLDDVLTYDGADWVNAPVPDPPGLATHLADTANPHSVTKAQVGLGSVENYAVASQAEAEAGTEAAKYMTPLRTAQAIAALESGGAGLWTDDTGSAQYAGQYYSPEHNAGTSGTAKTIDWDDGNTQLLTLTGNVTLTLSTPKAGGRYLLVLVQDGTGTRTVTWPAAVKWSGGTPPTLSTAAGAIDIVTLARSAAGSGIYLAAANLDFS